MAIDSIIQRRLPHSRGGRNGSECPAGLDRNRWPVCVGIRTKINHAVPIPGCPPTLEDMVNVLRDNGVEIDMEDYLRYRSYLMKRYKSTPEFDPKIFS